MSNRFEESGVVSQALEIFSDDVPAIEVARTYLLAELPNIIGDKLASDKDGLDQALQKLSDSQILRLLEGISYSYRMNSVFHVVTDRSRCWLDVELPIGAIKLTGTKPHINEIVYGDTIANDPIKFAGFLSGYFEQHTEASDDPLELDEFRPTTDLVDLRSTKVLGIEKNGSIEIIDGTHRMVVAAILGATNVRALIATPTAGESSRMRGDSTFLTMRQQYEASRSSAEREIILEACVLLARDSRDGASAVQTYWIDHPRDVELKAAGNDILSRLKSLKS